MSAARHCSYLEFESFLPRRLNNLFTQLHIKNKVMIRASIYEHVFPRNARLERRARNIVGGGGDEGQGMLMMFVSVVVNQKMVLRRRVYGENTGCMDFSKCIS